MFSGAENSATTLHRLYPGHGDCLIMLTLVSLPALVELRQFCVTIEDGIPSTLYSNAGSHDTGF